MFWLVALSRRTRPKFDCCCCCCCCWADFVSAAAAAAAAAAAPMLPIPSGSLACCCCCGLSLTESNFSSFPLAFPRKIYLQYNNVDFPLYLQTKYFTVVAVLVLVLLQRLERVQDWLVHRPKTGHQALELEINTFNQYFVGNLSLYHLVPLPDPP